MFAAELAYCVEKAIPYSQFLDWPEDDRIKVVGFRAWDSHRCPQCGTFPADWLDDDGRVKRDAPFEGFTIKCYGCQEVHEHQQLDHIKDDPTIRVELRRVHPDAHDLNE